MYKRIAKNAGKYIPAIAGCIVIIAIAVSLIRSDDLKNENAPEYLLIYKENYDRNGSWPSFSEMYPYTEFYSLNGDNFNKIEKKEYNHWQYRVDGLEYGYVAQKKKYRFVVKTSSKDPSKWIIESVENQSACIESYIETVKKELADENYKCEVYYTPQLPDDFERIVPMMRQMRIAENKRTYIDVWEFADDYFHISVKYEDENGRTDAVFHNEICLGKNLPRKTNVGTMNFGMFCISS